MGHTINRDLDSLGLPAERTHASAKTLNGRQKSDIANGGPSAVGSAAKKVVPDTDTDPAAEKASVNGVGVRSATEAPDAPDVALANGRIEPSAAQTTIVVFDAESENGPDYSDLLTALRDVPAILLGKDAEPICIAPTADELHALDKLISSLTDLYTPADRAQLLKAYVVASYAHRKQIRNSGEPYVTHPIAVSGILASLNMDPDTLAAGLLHDVVEDTEFDMEVVREQFGETIANLVDGVTKLKKINEIGNTGEGIADAKAESLRKMFLAMVDDVRVVIIKLADRLHNMRTLGSQKKHKQKRIARETLDIFAPLANRLGIWQIKWELEDLSFRYLEPNTYRELARAVEQKRDDREKWVADTRAELGVELAKAGIKAEITGRPKHIYSIYRKMHRKDIDFDQIYDIHGFRIVVDSEAECYQALGVVHGIWRPIPGEFDDYIANPKDNMYRSLHTAVLSRRSGRPMEIQIRTREMHEVAERGIAAHWQYKEEKRHERRFQEKISWLRQLMEWRQDVSDAAEFVKGMKTDVFHDRVYVFTPQGDVIDLPAGSTPIDFAYAIHTELGHRCRGANIKGKLVPLDYKLQNGDQVTVISAKRGGPSRDWLNPNLEYIATQRARSKIRGWLRRQDRDENIQRGRQMLEKEIKRLAITDSHETLAKLFSYEKVDDFLAAIGYGDVNSQQLAQKVLEKERKEREKELAEDPFAAWEQRKDGTVVDASRGVDDGFSVQGVEGLLTRLGQCCHPVPGDAIVGYVTRGSGVTIHRTSCPNVSNIVRHGQGNRLVDVQWADQPESSYPVRIQVSAYDRSGLMRDVAALVADEHINMISVEALTGQEGNLALINATLGIRDATQLTRILTKIDRLPNVVDARRTAS